MFADPDFQPTASLETLRCRARLLAELRAFFHEHNFWEVETPLLSQECCVDAWLDPFVVQVTATHRLYLQTSPEFAMKRLVTAGADRIYQVTRAFRREEQGRLHNSEFTLVEWYECGSNQCQQMELVESLVRRLFKVRADEQPGTHGSPPLQPFLRLSYEEAFQKHLGFSPWTATCQALAVAARESGQSLPDGIENDRDGLLNLLLTGCIEPRLRELGGVLLHDFPASQAALARLSESPPRVAQRFELYLEGVEICNGYRELTAPEELRQRFQYQNERRLAAGKEPIPVETRFLQAVQAGLPDCCGVALGFDRLVMFCLGKSFIADVIPFPFDRA